MIDVRRSDSKARQTSIGDLSSDLEEDVVAHVSFYRSHCEDRTE